MARPAAAAPARRAVAKAAPPQKRERAQRPSSLRNKRQKQRKKTWLFLLVLFIVLLGIVVYVLWLPALRVQAVSAEGADAEGIEAVALGALRGTTFGVLPKSSIFLIPEHEVRARVLEAYPHVQAVSIGATGLTTLSVKTIGRSDAFVWCGESPALPAASCYKADAEGLIFAPMDALATTTATTSDILVYGPLDGAGETPVRAHVAYSSALPGSLKFIKAMRGLGADIASVTLRADEVDLHTRAGTRITYVIGKEGEAAILAATSFPTLKVNDGSIEYIDLRFQNKVYLKRRGEAAE